MSVAAFEYRLYRDSELSRLQQTLQLRIDRWLTDWAVEPIPEMVVRLSAETSAVAGCWLVDAETKVAVFDTPELWSFFSRVCFAHEVSRIQLDKAVVCRGVLERGLRSFGQSICQTGDLETSVDNLPADFCQVGCLQLTVEAAGIPLSVRLSTEKIGQLLESPAPEPSILPAFPLSRLPLDGEIQLQVYFQPTQMALGDMTHAQVGDVIRLDHQVGQPFELRDQNNKILGHAFPGTDADRLQIRVAKN